MLFRAIAYVRCDLTQPPPVDDDPEVVVFFEAPDREAARRALRPLLALAWSRPPERSDYYDLDSERDLFEMALGGVDTGDARLLEAGSDGCRVLYAEVARTQLLVGPATLPRLQAAQWAVGELKPVTCHRLREPLLLGEPIENGRKVGGRHPLSTSMATQGALEAAP